jgi:hypothetical protein
MADSRFRSHVTEHVPDLHSESVVVAPSLSGATHPFLETRKLDISVDVVIIDAGLSNELQPESLAHEAAPAVRPHEVLCMNHFVAGGTVLRVLLQVSCDVFARVFEPSQLSAELDTHAEATLEALSEDLLQRVLPENQTITL